MYNYKSTSLSSTIMQLLHNTIIPIHSFVIFKTMANNKRLISLITVHIHHLPLVVLVFVLILAATPPVLAGKVPAVIVFGDSTVDTGNNNGIKTPLKSNFVPYGQDFEGGRPTGRFCNGRNPSDFVSEYLGLKKTVPAYLDPLYGIQDFATGVVFASAGTGLDDTTASVLNVIPLWKEIEFYKDYQDRLRGYLGEAKANETIHEAVYVISIGTNDFLENYYLLPMTRLMFTIQEFEDHLLSIAKKFIQDIYHLGARKILFTALSPIGCLPLERTINFFGMHQCKEEYNRVALEFNAKLKVMVYQLNKQLPGLILFLNNPYNLVRQMIRKPSLFGFDVTWKACCGTGLVEMSYLCKLDSPLTCSDPDKYLFWDSFHPSEKANRIISQYTFKKILYKFLR